MKTSEVVVTNTKALLESFGDEELVIMPLSRYREIMEMIEDLEDAIAMKKAMETSRRLLPYSEVRARLMDKGILE
jgi:PHD/YefM family antitoxin component YafN of YafNO toxin-antitoxin module